MTAAVTVAMHPSVAGALELRTVCLLRKLLVDANHAWSQCNGTGIILAAAQARHIHICHIKAVCSEFVSFFAVYDCNQTAACYSHIFTH